MPQYTRKPIGNFLLKKDLQLRLTSKIVLAMVGATVISFATLLFVYYLRYQSVILYQMDQAANLKKENIIHILLSPLVISAGINIILAIVVGMYSSRKFAVLIFKLERWLRLLREGNMTANLRFREKDDMQQLSSECDKLSHSLQQRFITIKQQIEELRHQRVDTQALNKIDEVFDQLILESESIQVDTDYVRRPQ
ncbi:MAG: hypothetical protein ACOC41_06085 [Chitinivibrionales bacterium]